MARALACPDAAIQEAATRLAFIAPRFSVAHMTDEIEALYRQLLAKRR
jgi:hypothetical protein